MTILEKMAQEDDERARKCRSTGISKTWKVKWVIPNEGIEVETNIQTPRSCLNRVRAMKEKSPSGTIVEVYFEGKLIYKSTKI